MTARAIPSGPFAVIAALRERRWQAVVAAFVSQLLVLGASIYSFGVFVKPLAAEFGVGRTAVSGAFIVYSIVGALAAPFLGALITRHSIRRVMLAGALFTAAGFLLLGTATTIWQVYVYFGLLVGAGNLLAGALPCASLIVSWFDKDRGLALGISLFGASAGAPLLVTLATWLLALLDWRWTAAAFGVLILAILPAAILLLVRDRPREASDAVTAATSSAAGRNTRFVDILRDPRLWIVVGVLGFGAAPSIAVIQTLHAHVTDLGFPASSAALAVAALTLIGACAKPAFGRLADSWSLIGTVATSLVLQIGALCLLGAAAPHLSALAGAVVLYGFGYGGFSPLMPLLLSKVFGPQRFPQVMGMMTTLLLPFTLVGFPFASWIQDETGSYAGAYLTFVLFAVAALTALVPLKLTAQGAVAAKAPT